MGERQALRIDYAHGTVPGTAFVIDEPFPIPPCGPRVPAGGSSTAFGSSAPWGEEPGPPRREEASWGGMDWSPSGPHTLFRGEDGGVRRPNGSYMGRPLRGGPGARGRGPRPGGDLEDDDGFRGGPGHRPGLGGFRGRGGPAGRGRGGSPEHLDSAFRERGPPGQRGGFGGRGRGAGPEDMDSSFRGRGQRGGFGGRGPRGGRGAGAEDKDGASPWGRGPGGQRVGRGGRGRGPEDTDSSFRVRGPLVQRGPRGSEQEDSGFGRGGPRGGQRGRETRGEAAGPQRGKGRGGRAGDADEPPHQGKPFTPKPVSKHATPGKILTSQIPPLIKRPPVSKFRNRFPVSDDSSRSPSPPPGGPKSNSVGPKSASASKSGASGPKAAPGFKSSSSEATDGAGKKAEGAAASKPRSPGKASSKPRTRRSRSRSRRRSRSPRRHRSPRGSRSPRRHRSPRDSRSPRKHRSRSRSRHRSPARVSRSPYRPMAQLPGDEEGFGIRVIGFPARSSDRCIQDGLYREFKRHGKIISVDMHGCAEERHAIIFYLQQAEREAALTAFKGHCFFGRPVHMEPWDASTAGSQVRCWEDGASFRPLGERADEYHPRATKILFVGNLEKTLTREDLNNVFQRFGEILGIDLKKMVGLPNRFAFIQFIDIASVCRAIKEMDGELLRNTRLRLGFGRSKPTNCLWVDGLPDSLTEAQLTAHFSAHGTVLKLSFDPAKGVALVFFKTVEQAEAALAEARGQTVAGNRIKVDFANSRSQAAFYRVTEPGPDDGIDVEPEKEAAPLAGFKVSDTEAGDVLRKVLLV